MYAKFSYLMTPPQSRYAIIMIYSIISFDCFQFDSMIRNLKDISKIHKSSNLKDGSINQA